MIRAVAPAVLLACAAFTGISYSQNESPSQPPVAPEAGHAQDGDRATVTITGCLAKGPAGTGYVITDQKTGEKYAFDGSAELDKFVNRTVTLTGTLTTKGANKVLRPDRVTPVSTTCQKA